MAVKASFIKPDSSDIDMNEATVECVGEGELPPNTDNTEYSDIEWNWRMSNGATYSEQSPTHIITGLQPGRQYNISGTLTVTCTKIVTDAAGKAQKSIYTIGRSTATLSIFTKPDSEPWSWSSIGPGEVISLTLYASEWNELVDKSKGEIQWQLQEVVPINVSKVNRGDVITANLYNQMAMICGVPLVAKDTLMTADHFIRLADAVSSA